MVIRKTDDGEHERSPHGANKPILDRRRMSDLAAGAVLCAFFSFMAGYFLGRSSATEQFTLKATEESFADRVYSSVYAWQGQEPPVEAIAEAEEESTVAGDQERLAADDSQASEDEIAVPVDDGRRYYAQLAGFRTAQVASQLVARLVDRGIPARVKRRVSKTARGQTRVWHQVVTGEYGDHALLTNLVAKISRDERIKGARIVPC